MAITGTLAYSTPLAAKRLVVITAPIAAASDTCTLTTATHGVRTIYAVWAQITGGMDADFQTIMVSFSGLVITVTAKQADGAAADEFTGTTITLFLIAD